MGNTSLDCQSNTNIELLNHIMLEKIFCNEKFQEIDKKVIIPSLNQQVIDLIAIKKPLQEQLNKIKKTKRIEWQGKTYIGQVSMRRQPHGYGKLYFKDGSVLIGKFQKGDPSGQCFIVKSDGTYYHGNVINKMLNCEQGTYYGKDFKYIGGFKNNQFHGYGKICKNNYQLQGQFNQGKITEGVLEWTDQQNCEYRYQGKFDKNMQMDQQGILQEPNGIYRGQFKNNKKHGKGEYIYKRGERFVGEYRNGQKVYGQLFSKFNDLTYQGQWNDDIPTEQQKLNNLFEKMYFRRPSQKQLSRTLSTKSNNTIHNF